MSQRRGCTVDLIAGAALCNLALACVAGASYLFIYLFFIFFTGRTRGTRKVAFELGKRSEPRENARFRETCFPRPIGELARRLRKGERSLLSFSPLARPRDFFLRPKKRNRRLVRRQERDPADRWTPSSRFQAPGLEDNNAKSEKYWAGLFFSQNAFPHS